MSDAWCDDCGEQGHVLHPVWDGTRQRWVCERCWLGYVQDGPEDQDDWPEEDDYAHDRLA